MSFTVPSGKSMIKCFLPSSAQSEAERYNGESVDQSGGMFAGTHAPAFVSYKFSPQAQYSPPFTPPNLLSDTSYESSSLSFPCTPSTPTFSPILEHDQKKENAIGLSFTGNTGAEFSYSRRELDTYSPPFLSPRAHVALPPKHTHRHSDPRRMPPPLILTPPRIRPRLAGRTATDQIAIPMTNVLHAHLYSPHFPVGHILNPHFVRKYAPGAQIGVGAFGFVVTGRDRQLGHEVAIKFIERGKVPRWGWSDDPELGHIPTEALLLKLLNHPGIIKFMDLFQDGIYFYLVQELHGSPWRGRKRPHCAPSRQKGLSAPSTLDEVPSMACVTKSASMTLSQSFEFAHHTPRACNDRYEDPGYTSPSHTLASSSSPCSPASPETPASPMTPADTCPNIGRRHSHDLFECIEEHQRLSESQARYIFAQVVDVVKYLDSIGVTHRDIKDENVLIDRAFRVKLIDFGAASCVDPRMPGPRPWYRHFRGTLAYAPAEIIRQAKCHQAEPADVWALGVLLSYLLSGRSAFPTAADAAQGKIRLHNCTIRAENEVQPVINQGNSISAACWNLLTRCLDPDPHTRASITEVQAHPWLEGALDGS